MAKNTTTKLFASREFKIKMQPLQQIEIKNNPKVNTVIEDSEPGTASEEEKYGAPFVL